MRKRRAIRRRIHRKNLEEIFSKSHHPLVACAFLVTEKALPVREFVPGTHYIYTRGYGGILGGRTEHTQSVGYRYIEVRTELFQG